MCEKIFYMYSCGHTHIFDQSCIAPDLSVPAALRSKKVPLPKCRIKNLGRGWTAVHRLCATCREHRLKTMRDIKLGDKGWESRYDWKTWDAMGKSDQDGNTRQRADHPASVSSAYRPAFFGGSSRMFNGGSAFVRSRKSERKKDVLWSEYGEVERVKWGRCFR